MSEFHQGIGDQIRIDAANKFLPELPVSNDDVRQYLKSLKKPLSSEVQPFELVFPGEEKTELTRKTDPKFKPFSFKDPEEKSCVLGLWPGEGNKIVFSGKGCEYHIEPMSPIEREARRKLREYQQTPAYQHEREEHLRWRKEHTVD